MGNEPPEIPAASHKLRRWQFGLSHILIATTCVAVIFSLATWGGWVRSDAVEYLSIAVVAAVFSKMVRRVLLGTGIIIGMFFLAMIISDWVFTAPHGRGGDPRSLWIFAGLLTVAALGLRLFTKASAASLTASLLGAEVFVAVVIVYTYGCTTLFEAFNQEHRTSVFQHLQIHFPTIEQLHLVLCWATGIAVGEIIARYRKTRIHQ